jgi:hypothetical protein
MANTVNLANEAELLRLADFVKDCCEQHKPYLAATRTTIIAFLPMWIWIGSFCPLTRVIRPFGLPRTGHICRQRTDS